MAAQVTPSIPILVENEFASLSEIQSINPKPHPYMVGLKHMKYAHDRNPHGMAVIDDQVLRKVQCAHPDCKLSYDEHTCDHVAAVYLKRDVKGPELSAWLQEQIASGLVSADKCDGVCFIETGFRVLPE